MTKLITLNEGAGIIVMNVDKAIEKMYLKADKQIIIDFKTKFNFGC